MASKLAKVLMLASLSHKATCHTLNMVSQDDDDLASGSIVDLPSQFRENATPPNKLD